MFSLVPQINKNLRDSKMPWTPCVHGFNVMAVVHTLLFTVKPENTGKWNRQKRNTERPGDHRGALIFQEEEEQPPFLK